MHKRTVYNQNKVWYNFFVKKFALLTTSLCALLGASLCLSGVAYAESDGLDYYPETFLKEVSLENAKDYAVSGEKLAILRDTDICEYSNGALTAYECENKTVKSVYYAPDGALCYGNDNGVYYYETDEKADITVETDFFIDGYGYRVNDETGFVTVFDNQPPYDPTPLEGYTNLKKCENKAYAVNGGSLYELVGKEPHKVTFNYLDYTVVQKILTGGVKDALANTVENPSFVSLKQDAFATEVDLDGDNGEYFKTGNTLVIGKDEKAVTALLLAKTGADDGISLVMVNDGTKCVCYIMRTADASPVNRTGAIKEMNKNATVTVADGFVYTLPFVSASTHLKTEGREYKIKSGDALKVVGEVTKADNPELLRDFYKVELSKEGETPLYGYVPIGYVSLFSYVEPPQTETPDPDYTEENIVRPAVLILLVVILALSAGGYVIFVFSSGKTKKDKRK